jgi:putative DNA primase/helicase
MERRIPEERVDPHVARKLTTPEELEGLLVLAVEGLRRLMGRGRFELPESVRGARLAYRERLDSVAAFVAEECSLDPTVWTQRSALYRAYRTWAADGGRLPVSSATFNDHLRRGFEGRVAERKREGIWGWAGIWHGSRP